MMRSRSSSRRLAQHHLGVDAARAQCVAHQLGMHDTDAEDQPRASPAPACLTISSQAPLTTSSSLATASSCSAMNSPLRLPTSETSISVFVAFDDSGDRKPSRMPCAIEYS